MLSHDDIVRLNKEYTLTSWTAQKDWNPISMVRGEGIYFWDAEGKQYIDWASQLVNVNVGHAHPHVIKAIQDQAASVAYAYPGIATEARGKLGEKIAQIAPNGMRKSFFTTGGADAVENAIKMARLSTGRQKILSRYRSFHGATFGAMMAGGDPRRLANEPGVPWVVHFHDPYPYRSPLYRNRTQDEGDALVADLLEETIEFEGAHNIAAILIEGYSGTSGVMQGGPVFWTRVQQLCDHYGILLIIDEVMSGWGRTGEWFGVQHYPDVKPAMIATAKGLTSGYVPMGAVIVNDKVASYFEDHMLWAGLTYSAHPLAAAAAVACIEVYQNECLVENAQAMGKTLRAGLIDLAEKHASIGDVRGAGLLQVIELVHNRDTREPMCKFNAAPTEPMKRVAASLRKNGLSGFVRWNMIFCAPPLVINDVQVADALAIIDQALDEADQFVTA